MPLFCRHNRFTAECPICSRGTVLGEGRARGRRAQAGERASASQRRPRPEAAPSYRGPHAAAGPYEDGGERYEVRLERVPGGLRLGEWAAGRLRRRAPVLHADDLLPLIGRAAEAGVLSEGDAAAFARALGAGGSADEGPQAYGVSPGRAGELREELRVEALGGERLRVARWILRPGSGWELQEAPVMLPASRFTEALESAVRRRVLAPGGGATSDSH